MVPPDAKTKLYILLGNPVDHSLSPVIHNAAFTALRINSVYLACPVEEIRLQAALEGMKALAVAGANVTSPYKEAVIPFIDSISSEARLLSSVNTIINRDGHLHGETTDGEGFYRSLQEKVSGSETGRPGIMVVGAGGAARAAAYALTIHGGAARFTVVNRTPQKGLALAKLITEAHPDKKSVFLPLKFADMKSALNDCGMIIYSLPFDEPAFMAAISTGKTKLFCKNKILFDLRYHPARTAVMTAFEKQGGLAYNGLGMLLQQAALSFELFTGQKAPLEAMHKAAGELAYGRF